MDNHFKKLETEAEGAWLALKERACADPERAKRIVMLDKADFMAVILPLLSAKESG